MAWWTASPDHHLRGVPDSDCDVLFHPESPLSVRLPILRAVAVFNSTNLSIRLMVMGMSGAGKTSFLQRLFGEGVVAAAGEAGRTQGLSIRQLTLERGGGLPSVSAIFTDFAGQQQYYTTTSAFLAADCVIVLTQDLYRLSRQPAAVLAEVEAFLECIWDSASGPSCCIVLLGTHMDKVAADGVGRLLRQLRRRFKSWTADAGAGAGTSPSSRALLPLAAVAGVSSVTCKATALVGHGTALLRCRGAGLGLGPWRRRVGAARLGYAWLRERLDGGSVWLDSRASWCHADARVRAAAAEHHR